MGIGAFSAGDGKQNRDKNDYRNFNNDSSFYIHTFNQHSLVLYIILRQLRFAAFFIGICRLCLRSILLIVCCIKTIKKF